MNYKEGPLQLCTPALLWSKWAFLSAKKMRQDIHFIGSDHLLLLLESFLELLLGLSSELTDFSISLTKFMMGRVTKCEFWVSPCPYYKFLLWLVKPNCPHNAIMAWLSVVWHSVRLGTAGHGSCQRFNAPFPHSWYAQLPVKQEIFKVKKWEPWAFRFYTFWSVVQWSWSFWVNVEIIVESDILYCRDRPLRWFWMGRSVTPKGF